MSIAVELLGTDERWGVAEGKCLACDGIVRYHKVTNLWDSGTHREWLHEVPSPLIEGFARMVRECPAE